MRRNFPNGSTACSATVRSTRSEKTAAAISATRETGIKDCSGCMIPHEKENFGRVTGRFQDLCARICELDRKKE